MMDEIPANNGNFTSISITLIHDRAFEIHESLEKQN